MLWLPSLMTVLRPPSSVGRQYGGEVGEHRRGELDHVAKRAPGLEVADRIHAECSARHEAVRVGAAAETCAAPPRTDP
jgi:hypothetical protein